jgi:hypothetical protein
VSKARGGVGRVVCGQHLSDHTEYSGGWSGQPERYVFEEPSRSSQQHQRRWRKMK